MALSREVQELETAHANGAVIEIFNSAKTMDWAEDKFPVWLKGYKYRIKPCERERTLLGLLGLRSELDFAELTSTFIGA